MKVKWNTWLTTGALVAIMLAAAAGTVAQYPAKNQNPPPANNQNPPLLHRRTKSKLRQTIRSRSMILMPRRSMPRKMQPSRPFQTCRQPIKPSASN